MMKIKVVGQFEEYAQYESVCIPHTGEYVTIHIDDAQCAVTILSVMYDYAINTVYLFIDETELPCADDMFWLDILRGK